MGWGSLPFPPTPPFFIIPNQPFLLFLTQILPNDNKTMSSKGLETRILGFHSMSANSLGQSMALFLFQYISPPLPSLEQEAKGFAGITKCPIPKGIPEGIPRGTENPELPRKASSDNIRKGTEQKEGDKGRGSPSGNPGALSRAEAPPQAHPPSSRGTAVRPRRGCLWTQQAKVTPQARVPETHSPPLQSQLAGVEQARSTSPRIIFCQKAYETRC